MLLFVNNGQLSCSHDTKNGLITIFCSVSKDNFDRRVVVFY